ncbi:MAG: hypothetical protein RIB59_14490 [Rhodospirillales bacterium]
MTALFTLLSLFDPVLIVAAVALCFFFAKHWWWVFLLMLIPALALELVYTLSGLRRSFGIGLPPLYLAAVFWGFCGFLLGILWRRRKNKKTD